MEDKLRRYVDSLFEETTPTRKSVELKEEMIQNLNDKYRDLISEGKTNEAAYNIAVAGIGDISELLNELEPKNNQIELGYEEVEDARKKSAALTAIAVMMYILSPLPLIILSYVSARNVDAIGLPIFFLMVAGATGLLIYNNMTQPKNRRTQDSVVGDFREWQSDNKERKQMRKAISSALWSITILVYLVVSFMTFAWHITWIIFIISGVLESLINVMFQMKKK
ncbi:MAG: permease prefix domain 1-containing protein [Oscillospiraceae bacterium]|nr:permease prefix domain 1-containing protein [Oscillospiraceae bacterium]